MTRNRKKAFVFERVLLTDRSAAFRGRHCGSENQRTASEAYEAVKARASKWWWEPVRRAVLHFAGVSQDIINLALNWPTPAPEGGFAITQVPPVAITYISRQSGGRRKLVEKDHLLLVESLEKLCRKHEWDLQVVDAASLAQEEQLAIAAKTTVSCSRDSCRVSLTLQYR